MTSDHATAEQKSCACHAALLVSGHNLLVSVQCWAQPAKLQVLKCEVQTLHMLYKQQQPLL